MDWYACVMCCLSSFGFFIFFFSLYLLITVPTKLNKLSRFAIHGHDFSAGFTQLYMTLGCQPRILLPCASGFNGGFFSRVGLLSNITQAWSQAVFVTVSASFSLLLIINRVFAVSLNMYDRTKNIILGCLVAQSLTQILFLASTGITITDGGKRALEMCLKILPYEYPIEMETMKGINFVMFEETPLIMIVMYIILFTFGYVVMACICGSILIRSIRQQAKLSQSAQFLANQRRITLGVIYYILLEAVGVGLPLIIITSCGLFGTGNLMVSHYAMISISVYPIFGPYYFLMSNTDYRKRIKSIINSVFQFERRCRTLGPRLSPSDHIELFRIIMRLSCLRRWLLSTVNTSAAAGRTTARFDSPKS